MKSSIIETIPGISTASTVDQNFLISDIAPQRLEQLNNDPFNQMEGFKLFAYFTAMIIQEDAIFTR